ncbi:hypothetical protein PG994_002559 [Apiospora phragmitis]|uniref:Uncharacterized protein n=1 Tax=Apiospora phragmitis TaxID=2905665 RepID=A0ABR1W5I0_9PEZI
MAREEKTRSHRWSGGTTRLIQRGSYNAARDNAARDNAARDNAARDNATRTTQNNKSQQSPACEAHSCLWNTFHVRAPTLLKSVC